ncbi:MAG: hypothetical protein IPP52_03840 [Ignavibacteria bacterium]|nr:hypothetical protein [Ignavibacteria bacterium]
MKNPETNIDSHPDTENNTPGNAETEKFIEIVHDLNYKADVNIEIDGDNSGSMNNKKNQNMTCKTRISLYRK